MVEHLADGLSLQDLWSEPEELTGRPVDQSNRPLQIQHQQRLGHALQDRFDGKRRGDIHEAIPPDGNSSSFFVRKYLQKKEFGFKYGYGAASNVNPYGASIAYALDRFDAAFCQENKPNLWDLLLDGYIVVSNRYTQANVGYQASKIDDPAERIKFIEWLMNLEYKILGIPEPNLVLILDLDPVIARELKARQRKGQNQSLDAHESNSQILDKARETYLEAAKLFPDSWVVVGVATKAHPASDMLAGLHSREVVHNMIWAKVKPILDKA